MNEYINMAPGTPCPVCGHPESNTVDTRIKGHGSLMTFAVRECEDCGVLWGEPREWYGVMDDD